MKFNWHNEKRRIKDLVPYVANPRQITEKQAKDLKASLERFGVADPIIINTDNTIIGGHQRKKILESLMGIDPDYEIDVRVPDRELSIDEMRELNVRLNKNQGEWNFDTLANNFELDDLLDWGFEKSDLDLDLWMPEAPEDAEPQIDRAEELREIWGVETGQLWQLGEQRLICGDCTDKAVVERVMDGERADMVFTDPPYGENYDYRGNDYYEDSPDGYWEWMSITFDILDNILSDGASLYVKHSSRKIMNTAYFLDKRYEIRNLIIWISNSQAHPDNNYDSYYEPIFYCSVGNPKTFNKRAELREKPKDYWSGEGKEFVGLLTNCWYDIPKQQAGLLNPEGGKDGNVKIHSCSMPEKLATRGINVSSNENDIIYDPFLGSGTTLIACERLNRKCRAIEISPAYVAVAIQRWVDVTGGTPALVE